MSGSAVMGLDEICAQLKAQRMPRWETLPDLELYMDQVLNLVDRYLGTYPGFDRKGLTASMVNNYVKLGVLPPPQRKRYSRVHVAFLLVICVLKTVLPIAAIKDLIAGALAQARPEEFYNAFCELFEAAAASTAEDHGDPAREPEDMALCRAALRAQAEQALALRLCDQLCSSVES